MFIEVEEKFNEGGKKLIFQGIAFMTVGLLVIFNSLLASEIFSILTGVLMIYLAFCTFRNTYKKNHSTGKIVLNSLLIFLYLYLGFNFIMSPIDGVLSIGLFIGWLYIAIGVYKLIVCYKEKQLKHKGLIIFGSILDLVLGLFLVLLWPFDSIIIISAMIAVEIISSGIILWVIGARSLKQANN
ncbi:DUF308 domain-containing protein [Clostridium sp.]|uniref:DUF308 domain-containing protein n=1 Tax=Clostridium sp. TaxID=1506 RepID=UPI003F2E172D